MRKKTMNTLMLVGAGAFFWWWIQRGRIPKVPETLMAKRAQLTDSMAPGAMPAAVQGVAKEGQGLQCLGCR